MLNLRMSLSLTAHWTLRALVALHAGVLVWWVAVVLT